MILIDNILISDDIVKEDFVCNLQKCKGACCWEGDFGAPLEDHEKELLDNEFEKIKPYLDQSHLDVIEKEGLYQYYDEPKEFGTSLMPDGSCVFLVKDELGFAHCGIEKAHQDDQTTFRKPVSCHLYPIRIEENAQNGFKSLAYDRWEICSNLCVSNKSVKVPLYQFVKDAIIRKYGEAFYEQLDHAAKHSKSIK